MVFVAAEFAVVAEQTLGKLPLGTLELQQLPGCEYFFELIVIFQLYLSFFLFLGEYGLRGGLKFGVGGIGVA